MGYLYVVLPRLKYLAIFHAQVCSHWYSTFDHDQATIEVCTNNLKVLCRHARGAHVTSHLLALKDLTWILTLTNRAVRTVRHGNTVRGPKPAEIVALHRAGKALAHRGSGDVDLLARHEMLGRQFRTDIAKKVVS